MIIDLANKHNIYVNSKNYLATGKFPSANECFRVTKYFELMMLSRCFPLLTGCTNERKGCRIEEIIAEVARGLIIITSLLKKFIPQNHSQKTDLSRSSAGYRSQKNDLGILSVGCLSQEIDLWFWLFEMICQKVDICVLPMKTVS
jgi:hypothetical protein